MSVLLSNYVGSLITIFGAFIFVRFSLGKKKCNDSIYIYLQLLIVPLIVALVYISNLYFLNTIISCFLCAFLFYRFFNLSFYHAIFYSIAYIIILTLSESIIFVVLIKIICKDSDFIYNIFANSIYSNLVINFIAIFLGYILRSVLIKIDRIRIKNYLFFYIVLLFLCILFFFYVTFSNIGNGINLFSGILVMIILILVVFSLLIQYYRNNELIIKYDKLLEFIKKYEIEIDNQRIMRHEIKNQLLIIKSKIIDDDKTSNVISYIDEIIYDNSRNINHSEYAKLRFLPSNGIKGLFYFKVSEAIEMGISVNVNISKNVSNSFLSNLNATTFNQFGKLIGIILDNAIEAAINADNKIIGIEIYHEKNKVVFIISNTYKLLVVTGMRKLSRSTKGEGRGYGLLLAKTIIKRNNKFSLDTEITDDLYSQKLVIKK